MAEQGISRISGTIVTNISRVSGSTLASIWSVSGEQRQASLFSTLQNTNWASYTLGSNNASFVAVGSSSSRAQVFFQYDNHSSGDTYDFEFDKTGTTGIRIFEVRISTNPDLFSVSGGGLVDIGAQSGLLKPSITASTTNSTIYIGFYKGNSTSTDTLTIDNLLVTKS